MAKYRNKKNGRIAVMLEEDKKYKTVLLQFEDNDEETQISTSTLKRWWEAVEEDEDEEYDEDEDYEEDEESEDYDEDEEDYDEDEDEEEQDEDDDEEDEEDEEDDEDDDEDTEDEDLEEDSEDVDDEEDEDSDDEDEEDDSDEDDEEEEQDDEEEDEEPAPKKSKKPAKEKKPAAPRKKSEESKEVKELVEYSESCATEQGGEIFQPQSQPRNRAFKVGGHMYARLLYSTKAVTVACRKDAVDKTGLKPTKSINHMFSELYTFEKLDKTAKANIKKLLKVSFDYQLAKNNAGPKPKAKKADKKEAAKKNSKKKEK